MKIHYLFLCSLLLLNVSAALPAAEQQPLVTSLPENPALSRDDKAALQHALVELSRSAESIGTGDQGTLMDNLILAVELRNKLLLTYGRQAKNEVTFLNSNISTLKQYFMFTASVVHSNWVSTVNDKKSGRSMSADEPKAAVDKRGHSL